VGRGRRKRGGGTEGGGRRQGGRKEAFEVFNLGPARPSTQAPCKKWICHEGPHPTPPPQKKVEKSRKNHFRHIHTRCSPREFSVDKWLRKNYFHENFYGRREGGGQEAREGGGQEREREAENEG